MIKKLLYSLVVFTLVLGASNNAFAQCPSAATPHTFSFTEITCFGANDGTITVDVTLTGTLTFALLDVSGTPVILPNTPVTTVTGTGTIAVFNNLPSSSYTIRVRKVGCPLANQLFVGGLGIDIFEPLFPDAGVDQNSICNSTTATMAGNDPAPGLGVPASTGVWSLSSGPNVPTITSNTSPTTTITGLINGTYVFNWTFSKAGCTDNVDQVTLVVNSAATTSNAGADQAVCVNNTTLAGNNPTVGTGAWSLVSGTGTITNAALRNTTVTALGTGANVFRWTIANPPCTDSTDDITITFNTPPTVSDAGPNQNICATTATLAGNTPTVGTGTWTVISGGGAVTTPSSNTSGVTGLATGNNVFRWTISNGGPCPNSTDDVTIFRATTPTVANAGADQAVCATSATLAGNVAAVGTGTWTRISGSGTITSANSPTSTITALAVGTSVFRWTIANAPCTSTSDDVSITRNASPTSAAGADQTICATTATLNATAPAIGTGSWTLISGSATITSPTLRNSGVTAIAVGSSVFRWTVTNGLCPDATDDITITRNNPPTTSDAGPNQTICAATTTMAGNTAVIGTGTWTRISGTGTIASANSPTSNITAISVGTSVFRWTIAIPGCTSSTDDVTIIRTSAPSAAAAGSDQTICGTTTTLAATTPAIGTGAWSVVSGTATVTTPSSNTSTVTGIAGASVVFRWTVSNGTCTPTTDDMTLTVTPSPSAAAAGPDQTICATTTTLAATAPAIGTGAWSVVSGTATVTAPSLRTSGVTGIAGPSVVFRWTVSNGSCTPTTDDMTLTVSSAPTVADAGSDQTVCATTTTLAGNTAVIGTGTWTRISGTSTITTPSSPTSGITALSIGNNVFRWTIANAPCTSSTDDVTIVRIASPSVAAAGPDQTICATTATLAATAPATGTGAWSVVSGTATVTTPSLRTSGVTGIAGPSVVFRWTVSNGICTPTTDDMTLTVSPVPTTANAGTDQTICGTTTTLAGNTAVIGTGTWSVVSGTATITSANSPTSTLTGIAGASVVMRWTIANAPCTSSTDDVTITINPAPTTSDAGINQTVCAITATLAGNTAVIGTGTWTRISGTSTLTTPSSPTSGVTALSVGNNVFRWTIANAPCTSSTDDVTIIRTAAPSAAAAGPDQTICATTTTLAATAPATGTGVWSVVSGTATITTPSLRTSGVTGIAGASVVFRWTVSNGTCTPTTDDMTLTVNPAPTTSDAGVNQTVCATTATLAGNTAVIGTGTWTVISGGASVTTPSSPTSNVTSLAIGNNVFRWTIANAPCTSSTDDVTIIRTAAPTTANAGTDFSICGTTATLAGNVPATGVGTWSVVSGTATITSANSATSGVTAIAGASVVFRWSIGNGSCPISSDDVTVTITSAPTTSDAGSNQSVCATTATLAGNTAVVGTGTWTVISGGASVTTTSSPTSNVTGLAVGNNVFRWTIANAPCTASTDDVTIVRTAAPTTANAGTDFSICGTTATLAGNVPATGVGTWSVVSGTATITSANSATSGVTAIAGASVVFRWSIGNGSCPISSDDVTITINSAPTTSDAGVNQTVCAITATLAGNTAVVGTGTWSVISGTATITTPSSPTSGVTALSVGNNVFRWTIANAPCTSSTDDVTIIRTAASTTANAGTDFSICGTTATLAGNVPATGVGTWSVVSGTATITSANSATSGVTAIAGASVVFRWSIGNGSCPISSDDVTITINSAPTTSDAGVNQTVCAITATLAGNTAVVGTGTWSVISGTATITTPSSPTSGVTALSVGNNVFRWTIANAPCTSSTDDVTIIRTAASTTANAGTDFSICGTTATLAGNVPATGVGTWSVVSGTATITSANSATSGVTAIAGASVVFRWSIGNGSCPISSDDVTITINSAPTTSDAGVNQTVCAITATLAGNTAVVGTGTWSVISGTATITTPSSPTSGVTALSVGNNVFRWTIANAPCTSSTDDVTIVSSTPPTASNAGTNQTVCGTTATLAGNIPATGVGTWSVVSGAATFTNSNLGTTTVSALNNGANVLRWTIGNGSCASSASDVTITSNPAPTTANAGTDFNICATTTTLAGNVAVIGTGTWSVVSGTGTITSPNSETSTVTGISGTSLVLSWTISNGLCPNTGDQITITIDSPPTTSIAGSNQAVCATTATLNGNIPATGVGTWSVVSGAATFANSNLGTTTVSALNNGANVLRWTIGNGSCASSASDVTITSNPAPTTANAGTDFNICATTTTLAGNVAVIGTGTWSIISGTGTITSPNSNTSTVTGISGASLVLSWTISNGLCPDTGDQITITIDSPPTTSIAGNNQTVCATTTTLAGNIPATGIGTWSIVSGAATFANNNLGTTTISALNNGANVLRWTIGNGSCTASSSDVTITSNPAPTTANAGTDFNICATTTTLAGNTAIVGTGTWSVVSGTGTITSPNSETSTVTGISGASLVLSWTISNGLCPDSGDQITITIDSPPTASNAGTNQAVCATTATLDGNIPATGVGTWSVVSGAATFANSNLGTTTVSALNNGANVLRWTIGNGSCASSASEVTISSNGPTTADAGTNLNICESVGSATLAGNNPTVGTGTWSVVSGTGTITTPNSNTSTVTGITGTSIVLQWSISDGGICPASTDNVTITIDATPSTSVAGSNQTICGTTATLDGNIPTTGVGTWSVVSGAATFATTNLGTTTVSALANGANVLRWTIGNSSCATSASEVTITSNPSPTLANAGADFNICGTTTTLAGNNPTIGTGTWSVVSGTGTITSPNSNTSTVTGISGASLVLSWTISNGLCPDTGDQITITIDTPPTIAEAGVNQTICGTTATLAGNTAVVGTGVWTLVSGSATITSPNSPTSTITAIGTNDNVLRWTISNGTCPPTTDDVTITNNGPSIAIAGADQNICETIGSVTLAGNTPAVGTGTWSIIAGNGNITSVNDPSSTVTISAAPLVLRWTISNGLCADNTDELTITLDTAPTTADAGTNQTICGTNATLAANTAVIGNGSWTLVSGAGFITSFTNQNTPVTGLGTGNNVFRWSITNGSCSASTDDVTITVNPAILASITTITNPTPCGSATGGALVTASGGDGNFTYSWNSTPSQTDASITGVVAGVYNVVVTDGNLCTITTSASITDAGAPTVTLTSDVAGNVICVGQTVTFTPGGADTYNYFMDGNPIGTANTTLALQIDTMTVNHSISVTGIATLTGCTGISSTINIIVNSSNTPSVTISAVGVAICEGETINFSSAVTNVGATVDYLWAVNGTNMGSNPSFAFNSFLNNDLVQLTISTTGCGTATVNVTSNVLTVTIKTAPVVSITQVFPPSSCFGNDGILDATIVSGNTPFSFAWNNGSTNQSISGLVTGNYSVTLTDASACPSDPFSIALNPSGVTTPTLNSDAVGNTICDGTNVTFTVLPAVSSYTYTFIRANDATTLTTGSVNTFSTTTLVDGDEIFVSMFDGTCTTVSTSIVTTVLPSAVPQIFITALPGTNVCSTQAVSFTSAILPVTAQVTSYQWQVNGVNMGASPTFNNILDGDVITCQIATTCVSSFITSNALTMTITPSITAEVVVTTIPSNVVCENTDVTFVATPNVTLSALTYEWFLNTTLVGTNSTFTSNTLANNDEVFCVISATDPCVGNIPATSAVVTMTVNAGTPISATITASTNSICTGQVVDFTSTINPVGVVTYAWKIDGALVAGANASTFSSTTLTNSNIVSLEISYISCGLVTTSTSNLIPISVSSPDKPLVNLSKINRLCFGDTLTLSTNFTTGNVWSTGASTQSIIVGASGSYNVTVTDSKGCASKSDDVVITVGDSLNLTLTSPIFEGGYNVSKHNLSDGSIDLTVTGGFAPYKYFWSTQAITEDIADVPANNYHVVVVDEINCIDTAYIVLTNPPALELPTVFTPNGDGQNDFFVIRGVEVYPGTEVAIYNRWGNVVYNNKDYKNEWDGAAKSSGKVPDGTYFVVAIAKEIDGTEIILKGYVELRTDLR
ncbi:MAG: gliding motility-associated C-terminal domain-containing protein [Bacteroidota bacterium]